MIDDQSSARRLDAFEERETSGALSDTDREGVCEIHPLSPQQESIWTAQQFAPDAAFYNIALNFQLVGPLHVEALHRSLLAIVARHETLRSRIFVQDSFPLQAVHCSYRLELRRLTLSLNSAESRDAILAKVLEEEAARSFNLCSELPIRMLLIQIADQQHVLAITVHHLYFDAGSLKVFCSELAANYRAFRLGEPTSLPALGSRYADFAAQERRTSQTLGPSTVEYWRRQLEGATPLEFPIDRPKPIASSSVTNIVTSRLSSPLTSDFESYCHRSGCSLFMGLLSVFQLFLSHISGQEDITVGTVVTCRDKARFRDLIGLFVTTVLLRVNLHTVATFSDLLAQTRATLLDAFEHKQLPLEQVIREWRRQGSVGFLRPVPIIFTFQKRSILPEFIGLEVTPLDQVTQTGRYELEFELLQDENGLQAVWKFDSELFENATVKRWAQRFEILFERVAATPRAELRQIPLLLEAERETLLQRFCSTATRAHPASVLDMFREQVLASPKAIALICGEEQISYEELDSKSDYLATCLSARLGDAGEQRVGLLLERSLDLLIAVVATLKARAVCVPLDPAYPSARLAEIMGQSEISLLLYHSRLTPRLLSSVPSRICLDAFSKAGAKPEGERLPRSRGEDLMYILFTSGSEGSPKGVAMEYRPVANLVHWQLQRDSARKLRTLQFASCNFDVFFQEVFVTLCGGSELVVVGENERQDSAALLRFLHKEKIERLFVPPVVLDQLAAVARLTPSLPLVLKEVISAGEQLRVTPAIRSLFGQLPNATLHNHYGPTETHVVTAFTLCGSPDAWPMEPPIGRPIQNARVYLLDAYLRPVPTGSRGEIYVGGSLARGYWRNPRQTEERFIKWNSPTGAGQRLYRTGDCGRWTQEGELRYIGRLDRQVKIAGNRLELAEVEAVLLRHPAVTSAMVEVLIDQSGGKELAAYVVQGMQYDRSAASLLAYLRTLLPGYMVPSKIFRLTQMPLTVNGKIDRSRFHEFQTAEVNQSGEDSLCRGPWELAISEVWKEVLRLPAVNRQTSFFAAGGDSLLASHLLLRLNDVFGTSVSLHELMQRQNIAEQARLFEDPSKSRGNQTTQIAVTAPSLRDDIVFDCALGLRPATARRAAASVVFITGASGYVGRHLVVELLMSGTARVMALVRANSGADARRRLLAIVRDVAGWKEDWTDRLIAIPGDLAKPRLGLDDTTEEELGETVLQIYHAGCWVNFTFPYEILRRTNVVGTRELLRFACDAGGVPLHLVSSLGVFSSLAYKPGQVITENDSLPYCESFSSPYCQTKWVAERLALEAAEKGLPVSIYRPGWIAGHTQSGACNPKDLLWNFVKGCLQLGFAPELSFKIDFSPVDIVARAIVQLSQRSDPATAAFHLWDFYSIRWTDMVGLLCRFGYPMEIVPFPEWQRILMKDRRLTFENALMPFLSLLTPTAGFFQAVGDFAIDYSRARGALAHLDDPLLPVDVLFKQMLQFFVSRSFLPAPF